MDIASSPLEHWREHGAELLNQVSRWDCQLNSKRAFGANPLMASRGARYHRAVVSREALTGEQGVKKIP